MNEQAFWMVYGIGQQEPRYKHPTLESAEREAQRLAKAHPGIRFVVLEAKSGFQVQEPVQRITYVDYPF